MPSMSKTLDLAGPLKSLPNTSPPKIKEPFLKLTTVASIPHRTKGAPYVEMQKKLQELEQKKVENKYLARPPATVHPYNPDVSPQSYDPDVAGSKPSGSTRCPDAFGKSGALRTIKWEDEI